MRIQLTGGTSLLLGTLLATTASAQSKLNAQAVTGPVKNAGTYHAATGTWTRANAQSAIGAEVLYNNRGAISYFTTMQDNVAGPTFEITDAGRIPSLNSEGVDDTYSVNGISFAYCSSRGFGANLNLEYDFYSGGVAPCARPSVAPSGVVRITGLPTSQTVGTQGCWLVTVDLEGSTDDFTMTGDSDAVFDGSLGLDVFSYTMAFDGHADSTTGPILFGDPFFSPFGDGTTMVGFGPGPDGTGLSQQDFFWIETPLLLGPGCYWFGGYPANPWGGFYMSLLGDRGDTTGGGGNPYCASNANSVSAGGAVLSSASGWNTNNAVFNIVDTPTQPGMLYGGPNQLDLPFGCGRRCIGGTTTRGIPFQPAATTTTASFDMTQAGVLNIQWWYRDPAYFMICGNAFNLSNALGQ